MNLEVAMFQGVGQHSVHIHWKYLQDIQNMKDTFAMPITTETLSELEAQLLEYKVSQ